jgi:predicted PurR-regulated permease PerM
MYQKRRISNDTILLTAGLLLLAYLLGDVLLLVFAALTLAVGLDGAATAIAGRLPVSRGWAVLGVSLGIAVLLIAALGLSAVDLIQQLHDVGGKVIGLVDGFRSWLSELGAMDVIENIDTGSADLVSPVGDLAGTVMIWGKTAFGAVTNLTLVLILTLFLVADPGLYRRGLVILVPPDRRVVLEETLSAIAHSLRWWFLGQIAAMALVGVTVAIGTFLLGIDLWLALGVLTALLSIVPYIGTLVAAVPIVAVGFAEDVQTGVIVLIGYIIIQTVEGDVLTPMIQQQAVNLAPALLISMQLLMGLIFGVAGLILAAPLTIVAMVAVRKLWVEHTLGEKVD